MTTLTLRLTPDADDALADALYGVSAAVERAIGGLADSDVLNADVGYDDGGERYVSLLLHVFVVCLDDKYVTSEPAPAA